MSYTEDLAGADFRAMFEKEGLKLRGTGRNVAAVCPFHDDKNPSLSVNTEDSRWKCHSCDASGDIVDFVAKRRGFSTDQAIAAIRRERGPAPTSVARPVSAPSVSLGLPVATYDYTDESGALLFQVARFEPKTFRQRMPDGRGGWTWGLGEVRRVLYRLPKLQAAGAGDIVFLCEGERDVASVEGLGLLATTNAGGADGWRDEFSSELTGRDVAILEDNDEAGEKRSKTILASLLPATGPAVARSVRVVAFPELAEKGDVSDWLAARRAAGRTDEEIRGELLERVAVTSESLAERPKRASRSLADWQANPAEPVSWLVEGLIPEKGLAALIARPKVGKTFAALQLALCVAAGVPFLGMPTKRAPVLYLDEETGRQVLQARVAQMRKAVPEFNEPETLANVNVSTMERFSLAEPERLRQEIQLTGAKLVILDSWRRIYRGDENDSGEVSVAMAAITQLREEFGCAFLVLHHTKKNVEGVAWEDAARGSGDFFAAVDSMIGIGKRPGACVVKVQATLRAAPAPEPFNAALDEYLLFQRTATEEPERTDAKSAVTAILSETQNGEMPQKDVRARLQDLYGLTEKQARSATQNPPPSVGKRAVPGAGNEKMLFLTGRGAGAQQELLDTAGGSGWAGQESARPESAQFFGRAHPSSESARPPAPYRGGSGGAGWSADQPMPVLEVSAAAGAAEAAAP